QATAIYFLYNNELDADPLTPGKNGISVGEDPIAIATDRAGCKEITANAGSCDLSVLDIATAVDDVTGVTVDRLQVTNASGVPITARPVAMVAEPQVSVIGNACPATGTGLVYVAYPSCHLVAAIDVSNGKIVAGISYDVNGVATITDGNVSCPDECGGGGAFTNGPRPVTLDLEVDPRVPDVRRLVIGSDNFSSITVVTLDTLFMPMSQLPIPLEDLDDSLGVTAVALSPQMGMGGSLGVVNDTTAPGGQAQYVYAIATDNTVRVVDILTLNRECDTQVDPRLVRDIRNVRTVSCFPVGDPTTPARRPGAKGPGIELSGDAIPTSVDIVRADPVDGDVRPSPSPTKVVGYYAIVTAANGATFVVTIDDDDQEDLVVETNPLSTPVPLIIAHQLRDAIPERGLLAEIDGKLICDTNGPDPDSTQGNVGGPRSVAPPTRGIPSGTYAAEKAFTLPNIRHVTCTDGTDGTMRAVSELGFAAPLPVRDIAFPDLRALRSDETWTLTWEGSLSNDRPEVAIDGPGVREGLIYVDGAGMRLADATRPFCDAGVERHDIVQLRGCDPALANGDCPIGYECYVHPNSQISGLGACMLEEEADRLANACEQFLTSLRRYTVSKSASGSLVLVPRKRVLRTTPLEGCSDTAQCTALANYAATNASAAHPVVDETPDVTDTYTCAADPDRPAVTTGKRCIMTCAATADCNVGTVCAFAADGDGNAATGYCMEGVVPPQACVNAPQRFELRSHDAFTVVGTRSGYVHPLVADAGGNCVRPVDANPLTLGRIPLDAPACDPAADPLTGRKPDGTFDANPCKLTVTETENEVRYADATCANPTTALVERPTTAIRFHNHGMTYTLVDPTYPGDALCIGDRAGTLMNIPSVFTGYQLSFRQTGGFTPLTVPIQPSYPV
ncbi:MAG: hypothetical protein H0T79_08620, partial [Deltaproteobacteria bacterium]|nr:hypothetical protein [Deltaproteobacteria bacterium]